jgi:multidrug transporter EmrE-like cation transporter
MLHHKWALWSGFLGATASCIGKVAFTDNPISPIHLLNQHVCRPHLDSDLDSITLKYVYLILGNLMIQYDINLMNHWRVARKGLEDVIVFLNIFEVDWCQFLMLGPRIMCFIGMLVVNAYMIASFLKGMKHSGSVVGTALSSGSNFVFSALYGNLIWQEKFSTTWWLGFATVLAGVSILTTVTIDDDPQATKKMPKRFQPKVPTYRPQARSKTPEYKPRKLPVKQYITTSTATPPTKQTASTSSPSPSLKAAKIIGLSRTFLKKKKQLQTTITDRLFINECPLCQKRLYDKISGESATALADLSPNCFHVMHAKCLIQFSSNKGKKSPNKSLCIVCEKPINMWIRTKQAASLAGFWIQRVESILRKVGPPINEMGVPQPLPADVVRELLREDSTLLDAQKRYIDDDPSGLEKGLGSCLVWGGSIDYNKDCIKGRIGWNQCLVTQGLWKFDSKRDEIWLHEWGIHPKQRCAQCQFLKRPLPIQCQGCKGSSEAVYYCNEACQKRDWRRHKMTCETWQARGPK